MKEKNEADRYNQAFLCTAFVYVQEEREERTRRI